MGRGGGEWDLSLVWRHDRETVGLHGDDGCDHESRGRDRDRDGGGCDLYDQNGPYEYEMKRKKAKSSD